VYFKKQNKTIDRFILIELSQRIGQQYHQGGNGGLEVEKYIKVQK
jgi:hypothetical protein